MAIEILVTTSHTYLRLLINSKNKPSTYLWVFYLLSEKRRGRFWDQFKLAVKNYKPSLVPTLIYSKRLKGFRRAGF